MSLSHRVTELMEDSYDRNGKGFGVLVKDVSGRGVMNTIFGEMTVAQRTPSIASQFMYGVDSRRYTNASANGGSYSITDALLTINSGTNTNGDGSIQSKNTVRYVPGHETYALFTTIFSTPRLGNRQEVGLFDDVDGFWIGYIDTTFCLVRTRAGIEYVTTINNFDTDIVNGNNRLNFIISPQKGNVWKISYGYLGFANISLELLCPCGNWINVHTIRYPNLYTETHIANTYLPFRVRSINSTNNTNVIVKTGSMSAGIIDGTTEGITCRRFSATLPEKVTSTNTVIGIYRNKNTFNSILNHIEGILDRISISTDGAQSVTLTIYKNPTITNTPTWTSVGVDSTHEISLNATLNLVGAEQVIAFELSKVQDYVEKVREYEVTLFPNETAAFVATGNNSVKISLNWSEQF